MLDKLNHGLHCGIDVTNTKLIDNDYLELGYQIVECLTCGKQYIVFRSNGNISLELFNTEMEIYIYQVKTMINDYYEFVNNKKEENITIYSNVNEFITYPIGVTNLVISSIIDMEYGTETIINENFYDAINKIR